MKLLGRELYGLWKFLIFGILFCLFCAAMNNCSGNTTPGDVWKMGVYCPGDKKFYFATNINTYGGYTGFQTLDGETIKTNCPVKFEKVRGIVELMEGTEKIQMMRQK